MKFSFRTLASLFFLLLLCGTADARLFHGGGVVSSGGSTTPFTAYVALGDSITAGALADTFAHQYPSLLGTEEAVTLTNRAVSGDQACDLSDTHVFPLDNPSTTGNPIYTAMIGVNDANAKGTGGYEAVFLKCLKATITWLTIPSVNKTFATNCTKSAGWSADSGAYVSGIGQTTTTNGATLSCNITTNGGPVFLWYRLCDTCNGTFTYAVDAGIPTAVSNTTSPAINTQNAHHNGDDAITISGLSAGTHTVQITTTSTNAVSIAAIGTPPLLPCCAIIVAGVMFQQNDASAATTSAYNTDVINLVATLAGYGLKVYFDDVRAFVNSTTDMSNLLHPNTTGHRHLADSFKASWHASP